MPAIHAGIPVRVLNTLYPQDEGTLIVPEPVHSPRYAKSIVYKEDVNLITIASPRLMSAVQILSKAFDILSLHAIGVHMATTSEATVEHGKAIICVIGEELKGQVDVLGRVFGNLTARGIKARMVSQSASEINVAYLVDNAQIEESVKALHALVI